MKINTKEQLSRMKTLFLSVLYVIIYNKKDDILVLIKGLMKSIKKIVVIILTLTHSWTKISHAVWATWHVFHLNHLFTKMHYLYFTLFWGCNYLENLIWEKIGYLASDFHQLYNLQRTHFRIHMSRKDIFALANINVVQNKE